MTDSTGHIEAELKVTRARMDHRLTELRERLTPGQMLDDVVEYFQASGGADFGRNLMTSLRDNPLPATLTGIGLLWLMASASNSRTGDVETGRAVGASGRPSYDDWTGRNLDTRLTEAERGIERRDDEPEVAWRDRLNAARGNVLGLAQEAGETAEGFGQRIADEIRKARQSIQRGIHDAQDHAAAAMGGVTDTANRVSDRLTGGKGIKDASRQLATSISDNPLLLGTLALSVGALLGSVIPQSEKEQEALGGVAGTVRDTVRTAADEAIDRGTAVAEKAVAEAEAAATAHGLTRGSASERQRPERTAEAAVDSGRGDLAASEEGVGNTTLNEPPPRAPT
jgi:hypothetical protein